MHMTYIYPYSSRSLHQAPVPLSIFRSNSKFDENSECSSYEYTRPITMIFCTRHDSDTVVTCAKYRCDRPRIFWIRVFWIFIEFRNSIEICLVGRAPAQGHLLVVSVPMMWPWRMWINRLVPNYNKTQNKTELFSIHYFQSIVAEDTELVLLWILTTVWQ